MSRKRSLQIFPVLYMIDDHLRTPDIFGPLPGCYEGKVKGKKLSEKVAYTKCSTKQKDTNAFVRRLSRTAWGLEKTNALNNRSYAH